jgi:meso-butanediol dehydrogenase/(S,S)-butanediol dehydrogenase/diacetyl reductase
METAVTGQVAIVTGGGQGIGRGIALRLAQDGFDLVVADLSSEAAESVAAEARAMGRRALGIAANVSSAIDRETVVDQTLKQLGRLDVLVNNAAIQRVAMPLDVTEDHWDSVMDVNAKSVYFFSTLVLRHMVEQKSGRIVNLASMAGKVASTVQHPIYNVSKAAVIAMTKTLAMAHAKDGIRVNCVCPGVIETPMQDVVDREFARVTGRAPEEIREERVGRIPMGKIGTAEDVASVISFLAGPDSRYMTGQAVNVTGGLLTF